jgi:hypothetical protein
METKRLIPYSVHLPAEIYKQLKAAAGERKASSLVRDAITLIVEGEDSFNGGYNKGVRDAISLIAQDEAAASVAVNGELISKRLQDALDELIVPQNVKGNSRGKKEK